MLARISPLHILLSSEVLGCYSSRQPMKKTCILLLSMTALIVCANAGAQIDGEGLLARVNSLSPIERSDALIAGARKEGAVEWYSTLPGTDVKELIDRFTKRYPFIEIKYTRGGGTGVINRLLTEYKTGTYRADVIGARGTFHATLMKAGVVAKNLAPFRQELRDRYMDKEGYFVGPFTYGYVIGYNTRNVPSNKMPNSYEELLAPEWKGQLALDLESYEWLAGLLDILGEEKGLEFARKLAAQNIRTQRGHTLLTQLVAAGELKVIIDGYHYQMMNFKEKGAPVDFVVPDPVIFKEPSGIWVMKKAPHPHAAALLMDFLFTKEGQQVYADQSRLVARKDMEWDFGGKQLKRVHVLPAEKWGPRYNELVRQFDQIFRKGN